MKRTPIKLPKPINKPVLGYCTIHNKLPAVVIEYSKDGKRKFCEECWVYHKRKVLGLVESRFNKQ
jgi:hypothetical protein